MRIGYAGVSHADQDLALQLNTLKKSRCWRMFNGEASGA